MNSAIEQMLSNYHCASPHDYQNALKEIFQEIALLGLWRAKFFEHAAFYGGSALRILHGMQRFSEDLDFSLLQSNLDFDLSAYNKAIVTELAAFGFKVTMDTKVKSNPTDIRSAFLKADARTQLIEIEAPTNIIQKTHVMHSIKIKMEIDVNPPLNFETESRFLQMPLAFGVRTFVLEDLFAGKVHALLCRQWLKRVKGRDWYDFVWYVSRGTALNLTHLKSRLIQSGNWEADKPFTHNDCIAMLKDKINATDFESAKKDILLFIKDPIDVEVWSSEFFEHLCTKLKTMTR